VSFGYELPAFMCPDDVASLEVHLLGAILQQSWTCVLPGSTLRYCMQ
jgi:hypothetical protein